MNEIPTHWNWSDVAPEFDAHVREQLPWYDFASFFVAHIVRHYLPEDGLMYDIGASTGNIGRVVAETLEQRRARLIAIDSEPRMIDRYTGPGKPVVADATEFEFQPYDVAVCFLSLMFMPPGRRRGLLRALSMAMRPAGALIIVDKIAYGGDGYLSTVVHRLTLAGKVAAGAAAKSVIDKELSLIGVQRPLSAGLLDGAITPRPVEVFRFGEFVGLVSARPE